MLYTLTGTDIQKVRARTQALIVALQTKRPDASFFRLSLENWTKDKFAELAGSIGLFSAKYIILLDNLLTGDAEQKFDKEYTPQDIILEHLNTLKTSDHVWIIVEDALFGKSSGKELGVRDAKKYEDLIKNLKKNSDKIEQHDIAVLKKAKPGMFGGKEMNSFVFTDAFFSKNKIKALEALHVLSEQGIAGEEIHGALWWQLKVMFQVGKKETKGLSPFVTGKTSGFLKIWNKNELIGLSDTLIESYHRSHLGKETLFDGLMKQVLAL